MKLKTPAIIAGIPKNAASGRASAGRAICAVGIALVSIVAAAAAHEYWIEPLRPVEVRSTAPLAAYTGEKFEPGDRKRLSAEKLRLLALYDSQGPHDLLSSRAADEDVTEFKPGAAGTAMLVLQSKYSFIELEAAKFEEYLKEAGLEAISDRRKKDNKSGEPGREAYARCAKTFFQVVDSAARPAGDTAREPSRRRGPSFVRQPVGLPLEIVPATDPTLAAPGQNLSLLVLRRGEPAGDVLVKWIHRPVAPSSAVSKPKSQRTTAEGVVTFSMGEPGEYLVAAVTMEPASKTVVAEHPSAEWESAWASLTFVCTGGGIPAAAESKPASRPAGNNH